MDSLLRPTFLVLFLVNRVSCQIEVKGFTGESVLLPCIYDGGDLRDTDSVYWRDKDDNVVLDVPKGKIDLSKQSPKFKDRVEVSPKNKKGNFSISIKNLQTSDSGSYECNIPNVNFVQRLILTVSGEREKKPAVTATPPPGSSGVSIVTTHLHLLPLSLSLSLLFVSVTC